MLVLTRKAGERIVIGQEITVTVLRSSPGRVLLGIAAPSEVRVRREEIPIRDELTGRQHELSSSNGL